MIILQVVLYLILFVALAAGMYYTLKDQQRRFYVKGFTEGYRQAGILEKNNVIFPDEPTVASVPVEVLEVMATAFYNEHRDDV